MNQEISNKKIQLNEFGISHVGIGYKKILVNYLNKTPELERTNVVSMSMKDAIEELKLYGFAKIQVYAEWNEDDEKTPESYINRAEKLAKGANYKSTVNLVRKFQSMDGIRKDWREVEGSFISKD